MFSKLQKKLATTAINNTSSRKKILDSLPPEASAICTALVSSYALHTDMKRAQLLEGYFLKIAAKLLIAHQNGKLTAGTTHKLVDPLIDVLLLAVKYLQIEPPKTKPECEESRRRRTEELCARCVEAKDISLAVLAELNLMRERNLALGRELLQALCDFEWLFQLRHAPAHAAYRDSLGGHLLQMLRAAHLLQAQISCAQPDCLSTRGTCVLRV